MNYFNSIFKIGGLMSVVLGVAVLAGSCTVDDLSTTSKVELGAVKKEYVVDAGTGAVDVQVYANLTYRIEPLNDAKWAALSTTSAAGDGSFKISYEFNEEFPRMAVFRLVNEIDSRCDTIYLKQKGLLEAKLSMPNSSLISTGKGGEQLIDLDTNISFDDMLVKVVYPDGNAEEWVSDIAIRDVAPTSAVKASARPDTRAVSFSQLVVSTKPNTKNTPRTAAVNLSFVDGWGQKISLQVNVIQRDVEEKLSREISFPEARVYGDEEGKKVDDFISITGVVISDTKSGNAGENLQVTGTSIDYDGSKSTIYLQSKDGRYGFCIRMATPADNILERYSEVQIMLQGATMVAQKYPDRYSISGVTSSMIISNITGTASSVAPKEKYMNELTSDDINTWVTIKECEFPVRKGSIFPANEGYTIATGADRLSKYPILIRDIHGDAMYVYTNSTCLYRNDGKPLPYGSGNISGVLVHEKYTRFEYQDAFDEEDYGNIGNFQLRHMSRSDIQFKKSVEEGFSGLLTEYRFQNSKYDGSSAPTYGTNGWLTHTYQQKYTHDKNKEYLATTYNVHFFGAGEYSYLGPIGNNVNLPFGKNLGNLNGMGIILDPEKEHYNSAMEAWVSHNPDGTIEWAGPKATNDDVKKINVDGKAGSAGAVYTTFGSNYWWDKELNRGYAWMINVSTKGLVTDQLSMQISVCNQDQNSNKPRYWKAEWSIVDSMDPEVDDQWHLIGEYTVPDLGVFSATPIWAINAFKYINFRLPLEMLDKENVYIRLMPRNEKASAGPSPEGYANGLISDGVSGKQASALSYFAIRYNK